MCVQQSSSDCPSNHEQASDSASTIRVVKAILKIAYEAKDFMLLNSSIILLSKKHGQLKSAVEAMVLETMSWLNEVKSQEGLQRWLELVESLRSVTEGKVRVLRRTMCAKPGTSFRRYFWKLLARV